MKKLILLLTLSFSVLNFVNAQTPPNAFNYSAVARNAAGQPIASATIGIQITILKTSPTGASQYSENHFVNTDAFGLFNLAIGAGAVQSGSMATIDWSIDNYYLKVGMDATGGTNFLTMGTTQLLSVPYALHAKTAETLTGGGSCFTHYIGELYGGGIVVAVWKESGVEKGLIASLADVSAAAQYSSITGILIGAAAQSMIDGQTNTTAIVAQGDVSGAAYICDNYTSGGFSDWYLPSFGELHQCQNAAFIINSILGATGFLLDFNSYWSSTEMGSGNAWNLDYSYSSNQDFNNKTFNFRVRAVRRF